MTVTNNNRLQGFPDKTVESGLEESGLEEPLESVKIQKFDSR